MSRAINSAFDVLKMQHFEQQYGYEFLLDVISKAVQDPRVEKMRMFVLQNMDSPDPQMRRQAEEIYQQLTQVMSGAGGQISSATPLGVDPSPPPAPEGLMSTGNPKGEARPIMAKAFSAFLDAEFIRKNVIGTQGTGRRDTPVQYNMPPSIASLSQRPQIAEMQPQTTQVPQQAPGMFGRFKQPVMTDQTNLAPTGDNVTGGPATMNVQQNPENPMAGFGGVGQMMPSPGAEVTRMPHPSPFNSAYPPSRSLAGQGYTVNDAGQFVRPPNPYSGAYGTQNRLNAHDFETDLRKPVGEDRYAGNSRTNSAVAQMGAADQFTGV
jgi:hypothetical protein